MHLSLAKLFGSGVRRPDLVLSINGIAIGVIELKNSRARIGNGIRQLLSNQMPKGILNPPSQFQLVRLVLEPVIIWKPSYRSHVRVLLRMHCIIERKIGK